MDRLSDLISSGTSQLEREPNNSNKEVDNKTTTSATTKSILNQNMNNSAAKLSSHARLPMSSLLTNKAESSSLQKTDDQQSRPQGGLFSRSLSNKVNMPITEEVASADNNYYYNAGVVKSSAQPQRGPNTKKVSQAELEAANEDGQRNVNEEILDEGDFHYGGIGLSPSRYSILSNNIFNSSQHVSDILSSSKVMSSKVISPRRPEDEVTQTAFQLANFQSAGTLLQNQNIKQPQPGSPMMIQLQPCQQQQLTFTGGASQSIGQDFFKNAEQIYDKKSYATQEHKHQDADKLQKSCSIGFSGDLLIVDSPRSNASGAKPSNRMAAYSNTQNKFMERVEFDKNYKDIHAQQKVRYENSGVNAGFMSKNQQQLHLQSKSSSTPFNMEQTPSADDAGRKKNLNDVKTGPFSLTQKSPSKSRFEIVAELTIEEFNTNGNKDSPDTVKETDRKQQQHIKNRPLDEDGQEVNIEEQKGIGSNSKKRQSEEIRPSLEFALGLSPSLLKDYMQNQKLNKRSSSDHIGEEQINNLTSSTQMKIQQMTMINQSNQMSKRSETSHEVWNAQSSHQNGNNSPGSVQSIGKVHTAAFQSNAMSPRMDDEANNKRQNIFSLAKASVVVDKQQSQYVQNANVNTSSSNNNNNEAQDNKIQINDQEQLNATAMEDTEHSSLNGGCKYKVPTGQRMLELEPKMNKIMEQEIIKQNKSTSSFKEHSKSIPQPRRDPLEKSYFSRPKNKLVVDEPTNNDINPCLPQQRQTHALSNDSSQNNRRKQVSNNTGGSSQQKRSSGSRVASLAAKQDSVSKTSSYKPQKLNRSPRMNTAAYRGGFNATNSTSSGGNGFVQRKSSNPYIMVADSKQQQNQQLPPFPVSFGRQEHKNSKRLKKTATQPYLTNKNSNSNKAVAEKSNNNSQNKSKPGACVAVLTRNKQMKDLLTQFKTQNNSGSIQNLGGGAASGSGFKMNVLKDDETTSLRSSFSTKNKLQKSHPKLKNLTLQIGGANIEGAYNSGAASYNPMSSAKSQSVQYFGATSQQKNASSKYMAKAGTPMAISNMFREYKDAKKLNKYKPPLNQHSKQDSQQYYSPNVSITKTQRKAVKTKNGPLFAGGIVPLPVQKVPPVGNANKYPKLTQSLANSKSSTTKKQAQQQQQQQQHQQQQYSNSSVKKPLKKTTPNSFHRRSVGHKGNNTTSKNQLQVNQGNSQNQSQKKLMQFMISSMDQSPNKFQLRLSNRKSCRNNPEMNHKKEQSGIKDAQDDLMPFEKAHFDNSGCKLLNLPPRSGGATINRRNQQDNTFPSDNSIADENACGRPSTNSQLIDIGFGSFSQQDLRIQRDADPYVVNPDLHNQDLPSNQNNQRHNYIDNCNVNHKSQPQFVGFGEMSEQQQMQPSPRNAYALMRKPNIERKQQFMQSPQGEMVKHQQQQPGSLYLNMGDIARAPLQCQQYSRGSIGHSSARSQDFITHHQNEPSSHRLTLEYQGSGHQQQQIPDFPQIEQTDKNADFIDGVEKFTQMIQDIMVTKDEQMQNLTQERKKMLHADRFSLNNPRSRIQKQNIYIEPPQTVKNSYYQQRGVLKSSNALPAEFTSRIYSPPVQKGDDIAVLASQESIEEKFDDKNSLKMTMPPPQQHQELKKSLTIDTSTINNQSLKWAGQTSTLE